METLLATQHIAAVLIHLEAESTLQGTHPGEQLLQLNLG